MTHTHQRLPIDARGEPIRNGDDESADERLECAGWDAIEHAPHGCNPFNFLRVRVGEHLGRGGRVWEGVGGCERGWEGVGGCGRVWEGVGGCGRVAARRRLPVGDDAREKGCEEEDGA